MKTYNISTTSNQHLQRLYALQQHYTLVHKMAEKEIGQYVIGEILPDFSLEADDFKYCSLNIGAGTLDFDDEKKKKEGKNEKSSK